MHWLIILGLLSSTADIQDPNASGAALNRLAENTIRQQLGGNVLNVRVDLRRGQGRGGDFDYFNVTLDGFDATQFGNLGQSSTRMRNLGVINPTVSNFDFGSVLGGIFSGNLGGVLGGVLASGGIGRVGNFQINASNFTYEGVRYDTLTAGLGEVRFDWAKALRGDIDVQSVQPGNLGVNLRSDQATRLIAPRLPSVRDVRLRFDNGLAYLGGRTDFYGLGIPFEAGGRLSVQTNQVRADDLQLKIASLRLPSFVLNEITRGVNPLYDFDPNQKWPLAVNLNTAHAQNDVLAMRGGLQWLGFNRDRNNSSTQQRNDPYDGTWRR